MIRRPFILALCALSGCISARSAAPRCSGTVTATIRNDWVQPVDVYARIRGASGFILGEVMPGERRQFDLPDGATGVYYEWRQGTIVRPTSSDIVSSYACS